MQYWEEEIARYRADEKGYAYAEDINNYCTELKGVEEEIKLALTRTDDELREVTGAMKRDMIDSADAQEGESRREWRGNWDGSCTSDVGGGECKDTKIKPDGAGEKSKIKRKVRDRV